MMDESLFDEEQERIQRVLNESRKHDLEKKYGARFPDGQSKLPLGVESQWLNNIEEFERQFENAKHVSVREYLGHPRVKLLEEIPCEQVGAELNNVVDLLFRHNLVVDCLADVSDEDLYRFITSELMNEEIDDLHLEGWRQCFIYEEFHPNDEYDARIAAEDFLWDLFERSGDSFDRTLANDESDGLSRQPIRLSAAEALVQSFHRCYAACPFHEFKALTCTLDGEYATVRLEGAWTGMPAASMAPESHKGVAELRAKKSPSGGYDVIEAIIPGFVP